ncbi:MAG: glycosyltransferase family 4 protein [Chloroflexi bacterium]|nr:glycosyltransferase family 4 protein [Chloroflexota bacterium]MCY3958904.1 glycosyltransferase family 4 protein [Chloroflexota bacterium]
MSELRVLHLSPTWFGDESVRGGGERYPLELAIAMRQRTPTRLVAFGGSPGTRRVGGFDIEVRRTWGRLRGRPYDAIGPGFLRALGWANVVHCHQARSGLTALAALIGRPLGKRVFVTDHGGGGVNWVRRLRIGRWISGQLAQSKFAAATLPYVGRRTEVIYAGVDTAKYSPGTQKMLGQVVYVGRLLPHKGIETAIRGLPAGASLDIYGRPYDADYLEFIRSEASSRQVRLHIGASDAEIVAALQSACAFVMPSVYEDYRGRHQALPELVGLAPLEAMACGTAAVVSDVAGMPEIIPSVGGTTVPPSDPDALRRELTPLTSSLQHAQTQGQAARDHVVSRFTWSAVAERCLAAYTA